MSGSWSWNGDPGFSDLRPYSLDNTSCHESPSKPSPVDIVGEDLEEVDLG